MNTRRLLERMARSDDPVLAAEAQADLDKLEAEKAAKRRRTAPKRKDGDARKRLSKEERRVKVAAIRAEAFAEWMGHCSLCFGSATSGRPAEDLHHVLSGPERRLRESTATVLPVCREHHRQLHAGDVETLTRARNVCHCNEMWTAVEALERRIAKINYGASARRSGASAGEGR